MLFSNPLYASVTVYAVSRDAVFARMLELELVEAGVKAVRCDKLSDDGDENNEMRVFTVSSEVLEDHPDLRAHIEFGYSDGGTGRAERYFKIPFSVEELVSAVIECADRLVSGSESAREEKTVGQTAVDEIPAGLVFDAAKNAFSYNGEALVFTETEQALLTALYENRGNAVSREELLHRVWGRNEGEAKTNLTDVYIRYLREKLDDRFDVRLISSVRGKGYMLK